MDQMHTLLTATALALLVGCSSHEERTLLEFDDPPRLDYSKRIQLPNRYAGWNLHFSPNEPSSLGGQDAKIRISMTNLGGEDIYIKFNRSRPGERFHIKKNETKVIYLGTMTSALQDWMPFLGVGNSADFILTIHVDAELDVLSSYSLRAVTMDGP